MSQLIHLYSGDRTLNLMLVVSLVATLVSSVTWLVSRRLADKAALRHLVLLSGLCCCLASPAVAWYCAATDLTFVSIPLIHGEPGQIAPAAIPIQNDSAPIAPRQDTVVPPDVERLPSPLPNAASGMRGEMAVAQASRETPPESISALPATRPVDGPAAAPVSYREVAADAMFVWAIGAGWMFARLVRNCTRVVQLRRSSRPLQNERLHVLLREVAGQLGVRRPPLLLVTSRTVAPLAIGFGRPAILLPERLLSAISDDELRDVLVHELAHLQRGDQWIAVLQGIAGGLYWPIVSVHGLNRELQRAREEVCDNAVLARRSVIGYGETLLHIAEILVKPLTTGVAVGIIGGPGELERRIAGLIDPRRNRSTTTSRKTACLMMVGFVAGSTVVSATRFVPSAVAADGRASETDPATSAATNANGDELPAPNKNKDMPASPEADSRRTNVLHGKVLGPEDRPVPGARLYLSIDEWTDPIELGSSDVDGSYRFVVPEKTLRRIYTPGYANAQCRAALIARAKGFGPHWVELPAVDGGRMGEMKAEYAHEFHLAADFPIAGRIVDAAGRPVAGASIGVSAIYELSDPRWKLMHPAIQARDPNLMTREQTDVSNWFTPLYRTAWNVIPPAITDGEGRFQLDGVGADRAIRLSVEGPGVHTALVSAITRNDVAEFTQAIREKYPRTLREPAGYFYPAREGAPNGDRGVRLYGPEPTITVDPARTISGVVRDATTGEPIAGHRMQVASGSGYASARTDREGRYRILRDDDAPTVVMYSDQYHTQRYLTVVHRLTDTGLGEIVANIDIPRGVIIRGRVVEAGTDRPIISAPCSGCHIEWPGPLRTGYLYYFPLATNTALRGAPTGLYFEGFPTGSRNFYRTVTIDPDGRFQMAVPPGPGVLLVQSMPGLPPLAELLGDWNEKDGLHRLFPYLKLTARFDNDGAPPGDAQSLPGFTGAIPLATYHAYRVIDPPADATTIDVTLTIPRAPTRQVRFVDAKDRPMTGVRLLGLAPSSPSLPIKVKLEGSEIEVFIEPAKPSELIATTDDARYAVRTFFKPDEKQPVTIRLQAAGSFSGRLLDDETGLPLAGFSVTAHSSWNQGADRERIFALGSEIKTDGEGRFLFRGAVPQMGATICFNEPPGPIPLIQAFQNTTLKNLVFNAGEVRDLGEIRIKRVVKEKSANRFRP